MAEYPAAVTARLVLVACALLAPAAQAQLRASVERAVLRVSLAAAIEPPCPGRCPPAAEGPSETPALHGVSGRLAGAATGFGLGLALGSDARPEAGYEKLAPLGAEDVVLGGAGLALLLAPQLIPHHVASETDCLTTGAAGGLDEAARRALRAASARGRARAHELSWVTFSAATAQPFGLLAQAGSQERGRDALVVLESLALTLGATNTVKHLVHRPRPYTAHCAPARDEDLDRHDAWMSFFSGHTSGAVAAAVAAGTLADLHRYPNRGWVWASGLTLAATTGALRVRADQHWLTDVLAGAATGAVAGALIPRLHRPEPPAAGSAPVARPPAALPLVTLPLRGPRGPSGAWLSAGLSDGGPQAQLRLSW